MLVIRVKEIKMLRLKQHSPIEIYKLRLRKGKRNRGFRAQQSIVVSRPYSGCIARHLQALLQQQPHCTSLSFIVWPRNSGRPSVSQGHMQLINDKSAILAWTIWPKAHTVTKPSCLVMESFWCFSSLWAASVVSLSQREDWQIQIFFLFSLFC